MIENKICSCFLGNLKIHLIFIFICLSNCIAAKNNGCSLALFKYLQNTGVYEAEALPAVSGEAVKVTTSIHVISIDDFDLTQMDYGIYLSLLHNWKDTRLKHSCLENVILDTELHEYVWAPDTYIVNAKESSFHKVVLHNKQISIRKDGYVQLSLKLSARASCPLDLQFFPWDIQHCSLVLESYAYSNKDIDYQWERDHKSRFMNSRPLPKLSQYSLANCERGKKMSEYTIGNWSTLEMKCDFKRNSAFYVYQVMGPTFLTVCLSWVSFVIRYDQHPARISLGITSVLTMEAIQLFIQTSLPRIHYITLLDLYSVVSHIFVYLAMAEYTIVLLVAEKGEKMKANISIEKTANANFDEEEVAEEVAEEDKNEEEESRCSKFYSFCNRFRQILTVQKISKNSGKKIDSFAKIIFPFTFIFFNVIFYSYISFILPIT